MDTWAFLGMASFSVFTNLHTNICVFHLVPGFDDDCITAYINKHKRIQHDPNKVHTATSTAKAMVRFNLPSFEIRFDIYIDIYIYRYIIDEICIGICPLWYRQCTLKEGWFLARCSDGIRGRDCCRRDNTVPSWSNPIRCIRNRPKVAPDGHHLILWYDDWSLCDKTRVLDRERVSRARAQNENGNGIVSINIDIYTDIAYPIGSLSLIGNGYFWFWFVLSTWRRVFFVSMTVRFSIRVCALFSIDSRMVQPR